VNEVEGILARLKTIKIAITRDGAGDPRNLAGGAGLLAEAAELRRRYAAALNAANTPTGLTRAQTQRPERPTRAVSARSTELDGDPIGDPRWCAAQVARMRAAVRPWDLSGVRLAGEPLAMGAELRSRAVAAVERAPGASDQFRQAGTRIVERLDDPYGRLARGIVLTSAPAYMGAWSKVARDPASGHCEWSPDECHAVRQVHRWAESRETRAMSLTDTGGGYLVPFQLDPTVIIAANGSVNQIRQVARQVIATGDVWNGVSSSAVAWSYDAEAAEVSDDAPTFAQPTVPIYKAQGFVPISVELFEDAPNATQAVGDALAFGKDVLEAAAFATGTGTGMPTGIITALAGTSSVVASATAGALSAADLYAMLDSLPSRYATAPGSAWLANRMIYSAVRQLDVPGTGLWDGPSGPGQPPALLDLPALASSDMDGTIDATAGNDHVLVVGDFDNYVIADRVASTTVDFIPRLFGPTGRPRGQRGWLAHVRHGAGVVNAAGFRMLTA
jgi:HK97 family phage major capsid protein